MITELRCEASPSSGSMKDRSILIIFSGKLCT